MNESDLENELRALRPATPTARLEEAIARELGLPERALVVRPASGLLVKPAATPAATSWWPKFGWALAGAAVTTAALWFSPLHGTRGASRETLASADPTLFEPLESAREVIDAENSETLYDGADGPAQLVRYSSIERRVWANPVTGARLEVEVPREDVVWVPVSFQ